MGEVELVERARKAAFNVENARMSACVEHLAGWEHGTIREVIESLSAKDRMIEELRDALRAIVPPKLCGESWNLPHGEKVSIVVTLDGVSRARALLDSAA